MGMPGTRRRPRTEEWFHIATVRVWTLGYKSLHLLILLFLHHLDRKNKIFVLYVSSTGQF